MRVESGLSLQSREAECQAGDRFRDDYWRTQGSEGSREPRGVTPGGVHALVEAGHKVLVEKDAGALSAMPDDEYQNAGAEIVGGAPDVWRLGGT